MNMELLWFEGQNCGICHALKPKIQAYLQENYPNLPVRSVDLQANPSLRGQHLVFSIPSLLLLRDGQEKRRISGVFSMYELQRFLESELGPA